MARWGELKREFSRGGCKKDSEGGNHENWISPITGEKFQMGRHDNEEVSKDLEMKLRKKAGIPKKR